MLIPGSRYNHRNEVCYNLLVINLDAPIKTKNYDLVGRVKFSESLGKALLEWKSEDGIVVGLYGKWVSGKSSVVNLAIEYIENY